MITEDMPLAGDNSAYRLVAGQKVFGRYTLQRILGRGGMGVVWLARDEALDLDVALKFVPSLVVNDRGILNDLKRETRRNLALTHPHIVRTYDFVQGESLAGISMEYVDGDTLRDRMLDQPAGVYAPENLADWTLQLTEALHYAHQTAGIVHRDLKPANLLINGRKHLKVADFGIARSLGESATQLTGRNSSAGTLLYMSPQQLDGEPAHPLDDVYAVGATLYELCTSRPPFYAGELSRQIILKKPQSMAARRIELKIPAGHLPQNWEDTVAACLAKERAARPQSAREIAVRLGLQEAAAVKTSARPPLNVAKLAVKPLKAPTTPIGALPLPVAADPHGIETVKPRGRVAAGEAATAELRRAGRATWAGLLGGTGKFGRKGWLILVAGVILALSVMVFGLRLAQRSAPPASATAKPPAFPGGVPHQATTRAAAALGGMRVDSNPPGALVQIDGGPAANAPFVARNLALGPHEIRLRKEGYADYAAKINVAANQVCELGTIQLAPLGGRLSVTTEPPGLAIAIRATADGADEIHATSPWTSDPLDAGEYEITATRKGWRPISQKASLAKGHTLLVPFDLSGGTVRIESDPAKATVMLAGQAVGETPFVASDVQPGEIQYSLVLDGYSPLPVGGTVAAGGILALEGKLISLDEGPKSTKAVNGRSGRSHHGNSDDEHERRTSKSKRKTGEDDSFLGKLKRLPGLIWHH